MKISVFVALLFLAIGFAATTITLLIRGEVIIGTNTEFDVRFTRAVLDTVDVSSTSIAGDGKTIVFTTKELVNLGDNSLLEYVVSNNSTMYDADVTISCTPNTSEFYGLTLTPESMSVKSGKQENGSVKVTLNNLNTGVQIRETFECKLKVSAVQKSEGGEEPIETNPGTMIATTLNSTEKFGEVRRILQK